VLQIKQVGRVMVPVSNQDAAIAFYTTTLGFSLVADAPFGEVSAGSRSLQPVVERPWRWCRRKATISRVG